MRHTVQKTRSLIRHTKTIELIDAPLIDRNTWDSAKSYQIQPTKMMINYYGATRDTAKYEITMMGFRLRKNGTLGENLINIYSWGHNAEFVRMVREIVTAEDPRPLEPSFVGGLPEDPINRLRAENKELRERLDDILTKITSLAPECWDDDVAADAIVINYVESLTEGTTTIPGHADGCSCFE